MCLMLNFETQVSRTPAAGFPNVGHRCKASYKQSILVKSVIYNSNVVKTVFKSKSTHKKQILDVG